ncbi:MAG TPA: glycosyltransferase family 4 protein [Candidatus Paceibacterota bacterium]|nr:glycosyltransferase family 4 protein [Candidatus Paceibacterota bacterium]
MKKLQIVKKYVNVTDVKVLTNIRFYTVAGIAQYLSNFIRYNERTSEASIDIYGVDIMLPGEEQNLRTTEIASMKHFHLLARTIAYPSLKDVVHTAKSLDDVRTAYASVTDAYYEAIEKVRPDVILVNGTFFLPWCLLQAALRYGKARIVLHYHGVLTKEVEHWKEEDAKQLFHKMEREFDRPEVSYVFPSRHAKRTVEREVYNHPVRRSIVLPNPVSKSFFRAPKRRKNPVIGMVSRWTKVKNPSFLISLARYSKKTDSGYEIHAITDIKPHMPDYRKVLSLITLFSPVENHRLPAFYRNLGVLILPSHFETYGNVAQEALATGVPVLVSSKAGVAETLKNVGLSDWVIDFSSPEKVLEKVEEVIDAGVPEKSLKRLRADYTNETIYSKYARFLRDEQ